jgi:hypothetical protein
MATTQLSSYAVAIDTTGFDPGPWPGTFVFPWGALITDWSDHDLMTGAGFTNSFNPRSAGIVITNGTDIPATARLNQVAIYTTDAELGFGGVACVGDDLIEVFAISSASKTLTDGTVYATIFSSANALAPTGASATSLTPMPTTPTGAPWSVSLLNDYIFGVLLRTVNYNHSTRFYCAEVGVQVDFTMTQPTIATGTAIMAGLSVQLRGSLDPHGATAAFPVTVRFRYGTQVDESDWVAGPTCAPENGTGNRNVTGQIVDELVSGQTYYFRAYADYADGTVTASNLSSFTPIQEDRIMATL